MKKRDTRKAVEAVQLIYGHAAGEGLWEYFRTNAGNHWHAALALLREHNGPKEQLRALETIGKLFGLKGPATTVSKRRAQLAAIERRKERVAFERIEKKLIDDESVSEWINETAPHVLGMKAGRVRSTFKKELTRAAAAAAVLERRLSTKRRSKSVLPRQRLLLPCRRAAVEVARMLLDEIAGSALDFRTVIGAMKRGNAVAAAGYAIAALSPDHFTTRSVSLESFTVKLTRAQREMGAVFTIPGKVVLDELRGSEDEAFMDSFRYSIAVAIGDLVSAVMDETDVSKEWLYLRHLRVIERPV